MLTSEQIEQLRTLLFADLERLASSAQSALGFTMDRDRDRVGRDSVDESAEEELYSTKLRLVDRESGLFAKVKSALVRLDAGAIDECEECGDPISFKRLLARPVTTLCVECKTAREQAEVDSPSSGSDG